MSREQAVNGHSYVRDTVRDGDSGLGNDEVARSEAISETGGSEMGRHTVFEIREKKEIKTGRDIIEYEVITDEEDDARKVDAESSSLGFDPHSVKSKRDDTLESVTEETGTESSHSIGGAIQRRASERPMSRSKRKSEHRYGRHQYELCGASGPGSRDVGVQMMTKYIIPPDKILSRRRDVATQTRRLRYFQNPRIISDYSTERWKLLGSRENYVFDKEKKELVKVTTKTKVVESESDSDGFSVISEETETGSFTTETVTETEVSDSDTITSLPRSARYNSDEGPRPGFRNVGVQMSTKLIVQKEELPPVKVRDMMVQTKTFIPENFLTDERTHSRLIERIWNNQVPLIQKKSNPPTESMIVQNIDINPTNKTAFPILVPFSSTLDARISTTLDTPRPVSPYTPLSSTRDIPLSSGRDLRKKSPRLRRSKSTPSRTPVLVPYVNASDNNTPPTYQTVDTEPGLATDTDLEVLEVDPPRHRERTPKLKRRHSKLRNQPVIIDASLISANVSPPTTRTASPRTPEVVKTSTPEVETPTPEDADAAVPDTPGTPRSPSPIQGVEITYLNKNANVDPKFSIRDFTSYNDYDVNMEPLVLQPEFLEENEIVHTVTRRRRKLKSATKVPPGPDVLIRVGGGWMKEEHHRIQHKPLGKRMQPTADGLPFLKTAFIHNDNKKPVVVKHKRGMQRRYASFIT